MFFNLFSVVAEQAHNCTPESTQSLIKVIVSAGGGGAITVALNKIFDAKRIAIIVGLQGEVKSLQREIKYMEADTSKLEAENLGLKDLIETLRERSDSSINNQLLELQTKCSQLLIENKKAAIIIRKLKESNRKM